MTSSSTEDGIFEATVVMSPLTPPSSMLEVAEGLMMSVVVALRRWQSTLKFGGEGGEIVKPSIGRSTPHVKIVDSGLKNSVLGSTGSVRLSYKPALYINVYIYVCLHVYIQEAHMWS